jgi:hypothetical protein
MFELFLQKELSWAVYMIIIFIRNRIQSDRFSFKSTLKSWKQGFISLLSKFQASVFLYHEMLFSYNRYSYWITCCCIEECRKASRK